MENQIANVAKLIEEKGTRRERERTESIKDFFAQNKEGTSAPSFAADRILCEDGFEVWLGSLDDALSLEALSAAGVNAILNAALQDCFTECAIFKQSCGRRTRVHARGVSAMQESKGADSVHDLAMSFEQVRERATFDSEWYSQMLSRDVMYLGFDAEDAEDYDITRHFSESIEFLDRCRKDRRKVLVHCVMGINRSSALLVAYLCNPDIGRGMHLQEALALVAGRRGPILSNKTFLRDLLVTFSSSAEGLKIDGSRSDALTECTDSTT
mmetsp:Transcript_45617/g.105891  ORF Transcript_45617/g.105891 Transcript_45617/m.105891 type:complete len:269 (-) Transcript_45617:16-822(-)